MRKARTRNPLKNLPKQYPKQYKLFMAKPPDYKDPLDAEGHHGLEACPSCQSLNTLRYDYHEGFSELECLDCGYLSDAEELAELTRYDGSLLEDLAPHQRPPIPFKKIKA
ncbi:MAG: hypothetical protein R2880_15025 [Deinococcales bacterium]